jgi:hypothetical protein
MRIRDLSATVAQVVAEARINRERVFDSTTLQQNQLGTIVLTTLTSGRVLAVGGARQAELYDPAADSWSLAGSYASCFAFADIVTALDHGSAFVCGGGAAAVFDPKALRWRTVNKGPKNAGPSAIRLPDNSVLVMAGILGNAGGACFAIARFYPN